MSRPASRGSVGSRASGGSGASRRYQSTKLTITARLVVDRDPLEGWIEHEFVSKDSRVLDDNVLYAASRDGFSNELFHEQCDGKCPTVVFVILSDKRVFGGYTSVAWSSDNRPVPDPKAFLFSLTDGQERGPLRLPLFQNKGFAVNHYKDRGPLFGVGAGSDLGLVLDEDKLHMCRSNVGMTYGIPQASAREPVVSDTFMAGKLDNWDIEDIVVYHCFERLVPESDAGTGTAGSGSMPGSAQGSVFGSAR